MIWKLLEQPCTWATLYLSNPISPPKDCFLKRKEKKGKIKEALPNSRKQGRIKQCSISVEDLYLLLHLLPYRIHSSEFHTIFTWINVISKLTVSDLFGPTTVIRKASDKHILHPRFALQIENLVRWLEMDYRCTKSWIVLHTSFTHFSFSRESLPMKKKKRKVTENSLLVLQRAGSARARLLSAWDRRSGSFRRYIESLEFLVVAILSRRGVNWHPWRLPSHYRCGKNVNMNMERRKSYQGKWKNSSVCCDTPDMHRGIPRIELGTSRTRSEHYATKPNPRAPVGCRLGSQSVYNWQTFTVLAPRYAND